MRTCPLSTRTCDEPECRDGCALELAERVEAEIHRHASHIANHARYDKETPIEE